MTTIIDLTPLEQTLDKRDCRILQEFAPEEATVLEAMVRQGATPDDIRHLVQQRRIDGLDDNVLARLVPAARHLWRQREAAQ